MENTQPPHRSGYTRSAAPTPVLLALSAVVLTLHWLVAQWLQAGPATFTPSSENISRPFITRTIEPKALADAASQVSTPSPRRNTNFSAPALSRKEIPAIETEAVPKFDESLPAAQTALPVEVPTAPQAIEETTVAAGPAPPSTPTPSASARSTAYQIPGSLRLRYAITGEVRSFSYSARAELLWLHDGSTYDARLEVGAFLLGTRVQTSAGKITAQGLEPKRFSDKVRSEVAAHFEREKGKVIFSANSPEVVLQNETQDQLSIFIQIASMIAADPARYPAGTAIEMQAVGARDADNWRFVVDGEETLNLPIGQQVTLKLTRLPNKPYDLTVEIWLAPALGFLPSRIRLTQNNGDFIDQQLRSSEVPR